MLPAVQGKRTAQSLPPVKAYVAIRDPHWQRARATRESHGRAGLCTAFLKKEKSRSPALKHIFIAETAGFKCTPRSQRVSAGRAVWPPAVTQTQVADRLWPLSWAVEVTSQHLIGNTTDHLFPIGVYLELSARNS